MPNQIVVRPPFRTRGQARGYLNTAPILADVTGSGGLVLGGTATPDVERPQVDSDIVVEWDFDNDGDFSEDVEDITEYVQVLETFTGRDWPSLLTGKAGPGIFRATLINVDDRFSYFNSSSPLNQNGNSLKTGRRLRVRTADATSPDPALLARDRFDRSDGAGLGDTETSQTWSQPFTDDFNIADMAAVASSEGDEHLAVVDLGEADYYVQVRLTQVGELTTGVTGNVVGLVYRYQDSTDYSLAVLDVDDEQLQLINVVSGTPTTVASEAVEVHDDMTIGVLLDDDAVTLYLEGVPVLSATAVQTDETEAGIYAQWATDSPRPELDDFYAWDGLPTEVEGILWTGDVSNVFPTVLPGPRKAVVLEGLGWLSRPAGQAIRPPRSLDGRKTGVLVGETLARVQLLHPPGQIDEGVVTTGPVGMRDLDAIEVARRFEETEFGFLYESQEGYIRFDDREARDGSTSQVTFSDAAGSQFGIGAIDLLDWRREVFNRVIAGVAPSLPVVEDSTTASSPFDSSDDLDVDMPATVDAGDLLLVTVTCVPARDANISAPLGWSQLKSVKAPDDAGEMAIFGKVADGSEDSATVTFGQTAEASGRSVAHILRVSNWFGSLSGGVAVGEFEDLADPSVLLVPWGLRATVFQVYRLGNGGPATADNPQVFPAGYQLGSVTTSNLTTAQAIGLAQGRRSAITTVEDPGPFEGDWAFDMTAVLLVAIRAFEGESGTGQPVQVDDLDSQDDHNAIRTHRLSSQLFASEANATTYADLVLQTYADDRPILALSFWATKNAALRAQAISRRVTHRITVVADNNAGLGIDQDFFIEAIGHVWTSGKKLWRTTWELSPVPES